MGIGSGFQPRSLVKKYEAVLIEIITFTNPRQMKNEKRGEISPQRNGAAD
jgi:hypothetical protein